MKKASIALVVAGLVVAAANPALACGRPSAKAMSYRTAQVAKPPAVAKAEPQKTAARAEPQKDAAAAVRAMLPDQTAAASDSAGGATVGASL